VLIVSLLFRYAQVRTGTLTFGFWGFCKCGAILDPLEEFRDERASVLC
jgi:hypothetical protein